MKYLYRFFILTVIILLSSCAKEPYYRISQSIFIEDTTSPGLPIYSERGYNSFGAYWDQVPFSSERTETPAKMIIKKDSCHLYLRGNINSIEKIFIISFPEYLPKTFTDLVSLNGKTIDLIKEKCVISIDGMNKRNLKILEGEIIFKRAQNMYVDKKLIRVALSGTFSFKANVNDMPSTFSNGRFDIGFGHENFFYLQGN